MRYEAEGGDEANAGLQHARAFLEPVKAKHPWISYADLVRARHSSQYRLLDA